VTKFIDSKDAAPTRRKFISTAAAATAGTAALGFPMVSRAQTTSLRFQSTWPAKDIFNEFANDFAKKVNDMAGGRLKIEMLPSGSVVRAFDVLDAVNKGTLDGGHGVVAYWYGKNSAVALWGSGPAFGMNANQVLAWHYYGGGRQILDEIYKSLNMNVVSYLYGPMPTQPFGWFKKPITKADDIKGMKFRTVGLAVDMYTAMGAAVNPLPGGEIVPALDRGLLDGAEFNNASSDRQLGFPDVTKVCMLQSFHQSSEQFEVLINKSKYDALPGELKSVIDYAVQASSADMSWKAADRYSEAYNALRASGVQFYKTPDAILRTQLEVWDKIVEAKSAENPFFKRVLDSMRAFAERAGRYDFDYNVSFRMAYDRYFGRAAAPAKK
jgi:TRAP-type mannitol/chloroaromatic compound transport system substrate-binding protein